MLPNHETAPRWLIAVLLHGWDSASPQGSASKQIIGQADGRYAAYPQQMMFSSKRCLWNGMQGTQLIRLHPQATNRTADVMNAIVLLQIMVPRLNPCAGCLQAAHVRGVVHIGAPADAGASRWT